MLTIRAPQMETLSQSHFERWVGEHVHKFFPLQCQAAGARGVEEAIREGIARAHERGLTRGARWSGLARHSSCQSLQSALSQARAKAATRGASP